MRTQSLTLEHPTADEAKPQAEDDKVVPKGTRAPVRLGQFDASVLVGAIRALGSALDDAGDAMGRNSGSHERARLSVAVSLSFGQSASRDFTRLAASIPTMRRTINELLGAMAVKPSSSTASEGRRINALSSQWTEILDCFRHEDLFRRKDVVQCAKELEFNISPNAVGAQMNHLVSSKIVARVRQGVYALNPDVYASVRNKSITDDSEGSI